MKTKYLIFSIVLLIPASLNAMESVILLHGLSRSDASMKKMESSLAQAGFFVINIDYPSRTASIEELSDLVIGNNLKSPELDQCTVVHFVTHSLGGILVRSYFSRNEYNKLGRVIMLGPPNKGSEVIDNIGSWWITRKINGPAGDELGTGDNSVPNKLPPVNFELGVISGDRSINWINSLMIEGPDDGKVSVERTKVKGMKDHIVLHTTHPFMMKNAEVIEYTLCFLNTGSFQNQALDSGG